MITKRWLLISATVLLAVAIPKERDVVWVPAPPTSELRMGSSAQTYRWATVTQEQAEAGDPEGWKTRRKVEDVIRWNQWILLLPHVKGMTLMWIIDEDAPEKKLSPRDLARLESVSGSINKNTSHLFNGLSRLIWAACPSLSRRTQSFDWRRCGSNTLFEPYPTAYRCGKVIPRNPATGDFKTNHFSPESGKYPLAAI